MNSNLDLRQNLFLMAISLKGEPPSNIEDGTRGFKHTSNPHLGFATASLESGSANTYCIANLLAKPLGQQQNSPMAEPTFGSKSESQNGAQAKT